MAASVAFSCRRVFGRWSRNRRFIKVRVKLADTRRSSVVLVPDTRLQAVGLQMLLIVNQAVGWHCFLPRLWLPFQSSGIAGLYLCQIEQLLTFSTCRVIYLLIVLCLFSYVRQVPCIQSSLSGWQSCLCFSLFSLIRQCVGFVSNALNASFPVLQCDTSNRVSIINGDLSYA